MISFLGFLLWFSASFGLQGYGEIYNEELYIHPPVFAEVEFHAEGELIDIYSIYRNENEMNNLFNYRPIQDYFTVGASISIGSFSLTAEHMCQHPVANFLQPITGEYDGYNRIFITLGNKP